MNVIVFSPHPDDAEVMMGGTIAKYAQAGHNISVVLVTIPYLRKRRRKEAERAVAILGAKLIALDLDPSALGRSRYLIGVFDNIVKQNQPDIVYTSWINDPHQDHAEVSKASIASARKNNFSLYMYDQGLPSGLNPFIFNTQSFVDITDTMELKIKSILAHGSQSRKYGSRWLQGVEARASYLGYRINTKYAEAFEVVREIKRISRI